MDKFTNDISATDNCNKESDVDKALSGQLAKKKLNNEAEKVMSSILRKFNIDAFDKRLMYHFSLNNTDKNNGEAIKGWVLSLLQAKKRGDKSILEQFKFELIEMFPNADFSEY